MLFLFLNVAIRQGKGDEWMLILLAEDDPKIAKYLIHLLAKDGFQVDYACDGEEAMMYIDMNEYNVIILDWMMPKISGIEVLKKLRDIRYNGGILMLTAKDDIEDKITGLELGADDYLTKPFEYRELLARVKALSRRSTKTIQSDSHEVGNFKLMRNSNEVLYKGINLELSKREFQLFSLLLENNGKTVTRELIIDRVWGIDGDVTQNNLDAFIRLLRKKVQKICGIKIIINVRGVGYKVDIK